MNVQVVGGLGYLGSHICEELINRNISVACVDNNFLGIEFEKNKKIIHVETSDIFRFLPGIDTLIFCFEMDINCFYDSDIGIRYIKQMLKLYEGLKSLLENEQSDKKLYIVIDNTALKYGGEKYKDYLNSIISILKNVPNCFFVYIGDMFGFSNKMRFDTLVNNMVFDILVRKKCMYVDWWKTIQLSEVSMTAFAIVEYVFNGNIRSPFEECVGGMSIATLVQIGFINNLILTSVDTDTSMETELSHTKFNGELENSRIFIEPRTIELLKRFILEFSQLMKKEDFIKQLPDLRYHKTEYIRMFLRMKNSFERTSKFLEVYK